MSCLHGVRKASQRKPFNFTKGGSLTSSQQNILPDIPNDGKMVFGSSRAQKMIAAWMKRSGKSSPKTPNKSVRNQKRKIHESRLTNPSVYASPTAKRRSKSAGVHLKMDEAAVQRAVALAVRQASRQVRRIEDKGVEEAEWRTSVASSPKAKKPTRAPAGKSFYGTIPTIVGMRAAEDYSDPSKLVSDRLLQLLRPHQLEGCGFICRRLERGGGCLLADDMGLGKTATTLAAVAVLMGIEDSARAVSLRSGYRTVVACPAGLVSTWLNEAKKWLPPTPQRAALCAEGGHRRHVTVFADVGESKIEARYERRRRRIAAHGADWGRDEVDDAIARFERVPLDGKPVLIVSYDTYRARAGRLNAIDDVGLLVCDEAHRLKGGQSTETYDAVNASSAPRRLMVTATPVHNGLDELHALLALARIDAGNDINDLRAALRASALRRSVADTPEIRAVMPPRTDALLLCRPTAAQLAVTGSALTVALRAVTEACLRCSSVRAATKDEEVDDLEACGKWHLAARLLHRLCSDTQDRVVLVSRFKAVLETAASLADRNGWSHATIDGSTPLDTRADIMARLNDPSSDLFLTIVSLRAGGLGLNLVGANRFILFEPSWNPMDDDQAIARVWRFGQQRPVFVYRFATARSIEERVLAKQDTKRRLAESVRDNCSTGTDALLDPALYEQGENALACPLPRNSQPSSLSNVKDLVAMEAPSTAFPCESFPEAASSFDPTFSLHRDEPLRLAATDTAAAAFENGGNNPLVYAHYY